ncbi:MAG: PIN domain-containing protein [Phycicoccus sp.]
MILAEVLVIPAREGKVDIARSALDALEVTELAFPPDSPARLAQLRADTGLRMPDCCAILAAEDSGARIATFDDRLAAAARERGLVVVAG